MRSFCIAAGIVAVLLEAWCPPAAAQDWQKVRDIPLYSVNLTADQPNVLYDEDAYKFYTSEQLYLQTNNSLMLTARSYVFQPDIIVWDSQGNIAGRCNQLAPYVEDGTGATVYGCSIEFYPPVGGNYSLVVSTRDVNQGWLSIEGALWAYPDPTLEGNAEDAEASATDAKARRCQQFVEPERSQCLTRLSMDNLDGSICDLDPTGACRSQVGTALMQRCREQTDPLKREACFHEVAAAWKDPGSCEYADDPNHCYLAVAAEWRNPQMVVDRFGGDAEFDGWMAMYGSLSGDLAAVDWIRDNQRADYARIMIAAIRVARGEAVPADLCQSLRGNYDPSSDDLDAGAMANLCTTSIARAQAIVQALANASPEDRERMLAELEAFVMSGSGEMPAWATEPGQGAAQDQGATSSGGTGGTSSGGGEAECTSLLGQSC